MWSFIPLGIAACFAAGLAVPVPDCCYKKTVGGVAYTLVDVETDTSSYGCLSNCVYKKDVGGGQFCFAAGDENVVCGCRCGIKKQGNRIVGGQEADINEYPWMAVFQNDVAGYFCGAAIINSKWIITAAHCVVNPLGAFPPNNFTVRIGDHDLLVQDESDLVKNLSVKDIVLLPPPTDLALVKVDGTIDTSIYTPVCLPEKGDNFRNMDTVVTGWGGNRSALRNETESQPPPPLQEIMVPFSSADKCNQVISTILNLNQTIQIPNVLCFGGEMNKGACFGDSGGPLIVQKQDQESWTLAGLVSGGTTSERCAVAGNYGTATEVASFVDFIKVTTADGEFCSN